MIRKIMLIMLTFGFIISPSTYAQVTKNVELFDLQQEKVIKSMPVNPFFQSEATKYIRGIDSVYVKVSPIPKTGYMIKIPFEPPLQIKNKWFEDSVNEVIIIYPIAEKPFLLLFDKEKRVHIFNFKGDANILLKTFESDAST